MDRPQEVSDRIAELLANGTAADLFTPEGRLLRAFFTAAEEAASRHLPMPTPPPGWDGTTCDLCRGRTRFTGCRECGGTYVNIANDSKAKN